MIGSSFGRTTAWTTLGLFATFLALDSCRSSKSPPPLSPEAALRSFRVTGPFRIELFASEPHIGDPVDMAFDENGRVYVADMLDHPYDPPPGVKARSRIQWLEDTDGDGVIDRSGTFADDLANVTGILPWRGGLIVTRAPDILFLKDTKGQGKADIRKVLYTGFSTKVIPEGRVTNPRLGIDNWIYVSNSGLEGMITSPDHPERPAVSVRGSDFRFQPDRGIAEPASGPAQFGSTFDDWGNRFITQNTIHIRQVVIPMHYLLHAPLAELPLLAQDISDHGRPSARMFQLTAPQEWRVQRTTLRQKSYDEKHLDRVEQVAGYFTAASGGTAYTGDTFPTPYWNNIFTGDVSGNLVHRDVLKRDGAIFSATRGEENVEFIASTDVWSRPCNFANAPDGNLYMIDMYREFIENPESIPVEIRKNMDFHSGDKLGRIYRIAPLQPRAKHDLKPALGSASIPNLVDTLSSTNGWHRETAQRLLIERRDPSSVALLRAMAEKSDFPQARIRALWTLEGLSVLDPEKVMRALTDPHPEVRRNALQLSEELVKDSRPLRDAVLACVHDSDPHVQFQLALTLGTVEGDSAMSALAALAMQQATDPWFRAAILVSAARSPGRLLELLQARGYSWSDGDLLKGLASLIGSHQNPAEIARFFQTLSLLKPLQPGLEGLAHGLQMTQVKDLYVPGAEPILQRLLGSSSTSVQSASWALVQYLRVPALKQRAVRDALDNRLPNGRRTIAIRALSGGAVSFVGPVLRKILDTHPESEIQVAVVDALARLDGPEVGHMLVSYCNSLEPNARRRAVDGLASRREWLPLLVEALEQRQVPMTALEPDVRVRLFEGADSQTSQRIRKLLQSGSGDRADVVKRYQDVVRMSGDPKRGKVVFEENCGRCHIPGKSGGRVGPDLSGVNNKSKEEILNSILNPSESIEPRFTNYVLTTKDGRTYDGVIAQETPGAITLRAGTDQGDETIPRDRILEMRASSISLMPDGLEESISKQDLANVISYLRGGR